MTKDWAKKLVGLNVLGLKPVHLASLPRPKGITTITDINSQKGNKFKMKIAMQFFFHDLGPFWFCPTIELLKRIILYLIIYLY